MKILLINDDGIHAPGLWAAAGALRHAGDVFVVAPDREQSGVGSSLTLR
ncbi:MAG: 5'/3'-nucleotidase SurE, partial [Chloroflexi bacterium]|nr:5'/3'-nucleotidase SurE [Chloroflexota bacterium]